MPRQCIVETFLQILHNSAYSLCAHVSAINQSHLLISRGMPEHKAVVHITETLLTMLPIVKNDALIFPPQQAIMMACTVHSALYLG